MDQQTIDTYNLLAKEYDQETTDFWQNFPKDFLDRFVTASGKNILNIGSGPGRDGVLLRDKGKDVTCLDASAEMIKLSQLLGLTSVLGDFLHIPFEDNSFDGVWAYTSLLHVPKKELPQALHEIYRTLKPEGILALGMIEGAGEEYRSTSGVSQPRLFTSYTQEELVDVLKENGFELLYTEKYKPKSRTYLHLILKRN